MRVVVSTCDRYLWALRPFCYLFNTYWSSLQQVVVFGFTEPQWALPSNFLFHQISPKEYPSELWSDALIAGLQWLQDDIFVFMLEDYWLSRTADTQGINTLAAYMRDNPDLLRIDLTTDRLYNGQMVDLHSWGHYDLVETPHKSPYQMSFQAGIWRREMLLKLLKPNRTPWEVEIQTQPSAEMRVLGTRQWPLRYINALKGGDDSEALFVDQLEEHHQERIAQWLPSSQ